MFEYARSGNEKALQLILSENELDVDQLDFGGNTALHVACMCNHLSTAKLLISYGASLTIQDPNRKNALDFLKDEFREELVQHNFNCTEEGQSQLRLKHSENLRRSKEKTLYSASFNGDIIALEGILSKSKNRSFKVNECDSRGNTAVMFALINNQIDVAKFLIDAGADVWIRNNYNLHALHYAQGPKMLNIIHQFWLDCTPEARAAVKGILQNIVLSKVFASRGRNRLTAVCCVMLHRLPT
jgi:ankyrin repeat protein